MPKIKLSVEEEFGGTASIWIDTFSNQVIATQGEVNQAFSETWRKYLIRLLQRKDIDSIIPGLNKLHQEKDVEEKIVDMYNLLMDHPEERENDIYDMLELEFSFSRTTIWRILKKKGAIRHTRK